MRTDRLSGIGVLYGNLAPEGAIVKIAGVPSQLMTYKGKARVSEEDEAAGLDVALHGESAYPAYLGLD